MLLADLIIPTPEWDRDLWYAGHYYSGREPSSAVFDPAVNGRAHVGLDQDAPCGGPIVSPGDGIVAVVGYNSGAGNWVGVRHQHDNGRRFYSRHLHIEDGGILVEQGQTVKQGEQIAVVGTTGASAGCHNHTELIWDKPYASWMEDLHIDTEQVYLGVPGRKGDADMVASFQKLLAGFGYYAGPIDGIWGPASEAAEGSYMRDSLKTGGMADHRHRNRLAKLSGKVARWIR